MHISPGRITAQTHPIVHAVCRLRRTSPRDDRGRRGGKKHLAIMLRHHRDTHTKSETPHMRSMTMAFRWRLVELLLLSKLPNAPNRQATFKVTLAVFGVRLLLSVWFVRAVAESAFGGSLWVSEDMRKAKYISDKVYGSAAAGKTHCFWGFSPGQSHDALRFSVHVK